MSIPVNMGTMVETILVDMSQTGPAFRALDQQVNASLGNFPQLFSTINQKAGESTASLFQFSLAAGVMAAGITAALKTCVDSFLNFNRQMAMVASVVNATDETFVELSKTARDLGVQTEYGAAKTAEAMVQLGRMGFSAREVFDILTPAIQFASSQQEDLAKTTDLVAMSMRAFQLDATEASRVANVLAAGCSQTALDVEKLNTSMQYIAPIAASMGKSIEETTAVMGMLSNAGFRASTMGTSLRMAFSSLLKETERSQIGLKRLGLTMEELNPATHTMSQLLHTLAKSIERTNDPTKAFADLFTIRAAPAMLYLAESVKNNSRVFDDLLESITGTDEATRMFEQQMNTVSGQFKRLSSLVEELKIGLGEGLLPVLSAFGAFAEYVMTGFKNMPPVIKTVISSVGALMAGIASLVAIGGTLGWLITTLISGLSALKGLLLVAGTATLTLAGSIAIWVVAIVAVVAAIATLIGMHKKHEEQNLKDIESKTVLASKYLELEKKMAAMTTEEIKNSKIKEQLLAISSRLAQLSPEIVLGWDAQTQSIIVNRTEVEKLTEEMEKLQKLKKIDMQISWGEEIDKLKDEAVRLQKIISEPMSHGIKIAAKTRFGVESEAMITPGYTEADVNEAKGRLGQIQARIVELEKNFKDLENPIKAIKPVLDPLEEQMNLVGEKAKSLSNSIQELLEKFMAFNEKLRASISETGLVGFAKDFQNIINMSAANVEKLKDMQSDLAAKRAAFNEQVYGTKEPSKGLISTKVLDEDQQKQLANLNKAQRELGHAAILIKQETNVKMLENDRKYTEDYKRLMTDLNGELDSILSETNRIYGDSLDTRLADAEKKERDYLDRSATKKADYARSLEQVQSQMAEIASKGTLGGVALTEEQQEANLARLTEQEEAYLDIINKSEASQEASVAKYEADKQRLRDESVIQAMENQKAILEATNGSQFEILALEAAIAAKRAKLYTDGTDQKIAENLKLQKTETEVTKEKVKFAADSIDIINTVVSGATGELMGLSEMSTQVFSGVATAIQGIMTALTAANPLLGVLLAVAGVINLISAGILNAREEERKAEEERRKARLEEYEAVVELRKQADGLTKSLGDTGHSVESLKVEMNTLWSNFEDKMNKALIEAGLDMNQPDMQGKASMALATVKVLKSGMTEDEKRRNVRALRDAWVVAYGNASDSWAQFFTMVRTISKLYPDIEQLDQSLSALHDVMVNSMAPFDKLSDFDAYISSLKNMVGVQTTLGEQSLRTDQLVEVGKARLAKALEDAAKLPIEEQGQATIDAYAKWKDLLDYIASQSVLMNQMDYAEKQAFFAMLNEIPEDVADAMESITDSMQEAIDPLIDAMGELTAIMDDYSGSIDNSLGGLSELFNMGALDLNRFLEATREMWREISESDLPQAIKEGMRATLVDVEFDAVSKALDDLKSSAESLKDTIGGLESKLASLQIRRTELIAENVQLRDKTAPAGWEWNPQNAVNGLTTGMQIDKIRDAAYETIGGIDKGIKDLTLSLYGPDGFTSQLATLPDQWFNAIQTMNADLDEEADKAKEESIEKQTDMMKERQELLMGFAFAESQNERSNRMKQIRGLEDSLAEEQKRLEEALDAIATKRHEMTMSINEDYLDQWDDLVEKIKSGEDDLATLRQERLDAFRQMTYDIAVIELEAQQQILKNSNELAGIINEMAAAVVELAHSQIALKDAEGQIFSLQNEYDVLRIEKQEILNQGLVNEINMRRDINSEYLSGAIALQTQLNLLTEGQLNLLMQQRDVWKDISGIMATLPAQMQSIPPLMTNPLDAGSIVSASLPSLLPAQSAYVPDTYADQGGSSVGGVLMDAGGVVTRPTLAQLAMNSREEAIIPLTQLPDMMRSILDRAPASSGKTIILHFNDTLDMRGSISTINDANAVDQLYRNVILPAKRRNMERYGNILTEVIK